MKPDDLVQLCRFLRMSFNVLWKMHLFMFLNRMNEAQSRTRREYTPKPKPVFDFGDNNHSNGGYSTPMAPPPSRISGKKPFKRT